MSDLNKYEDFDLYLRFITPSGSDPTYSVLKAHLLFEEMLRDYLRQRLPHAEALEGSRLTFAQLLAVARSISERIPPDHWCWRAIADLNKIRNLLAHNLAPSEIQKKIDAYVELITSNGSPLPPPAATVSGTTSKSPEGDRPLYLEIDMVTVALFSYSSVLLGMVPFDVLEKDRQQEAALTKSAKRSA